MSDATTQSTAAASPSALEALAQSELFGSLAPMTAHSLAAPATIRTVRRGERLWDHGAPSSALAVVASGRVKCWSPGHDSRQWVNAVVRPGGVCGLAACVDGGPYTCSAEPLERSRVVLIPAGALRSAMDRSPALTGAVARALARDARRVLSLCEDVTLRTPVERLARYLVAQAAGASALELHETQTQIAAQLGTVREVVGRGLRQLESRGVIARSGRAIRVLRPRDLDAVASTPLVTTGGRR